MNVNVKHGVCTEDGSEVRGKVKVRWAGRRDGGGLAALHRRFSVFLHRANTDRLTDLTAMLGRRCVRARSCSRLRGGGSEEKEGGREEATDGADGRTTEEDDGRRAGARAPRLRRRQRERQVYDGPTGCREHLAHSHRDLTLRWRQRGEGDTQYGGGGGVDGGSE